MSGRHASFANSQLSFTRACPCAVTRGEISALRTSRPVSAQRLPPWAASIGSVGAPSAMPVAPALLVSFLSVWSRNGVTCVLPPAPGPHDAAAQVPIPEKCRLRSEERPAVPQNAGLGGNVAPLLRLIRVRADGRQ